ncbi:MAG: hypothetical protein ACLU9S_03885 [Oscillospiraceae bacterium]
MRGNSNRPIRGRRIRAAGSGQQAGEIYQGTILEHLLIQQLTALSMTWASTTSTACAVPDWNDALDMAADRGESVAFTCAYAGNLRELAALIAAMDKDAREPGRSAELLAESAARCWMSHRRGITTAYQSQARPAGQTTCTAAVAQCERTAHAGETDLIWPRTWSSGPRLADRASAPPGMDRQRQQRAGSNSYYDNDGQAVEGFSARRVYG